MRRGIVRALGLAMWLAAATAPALARITVDDARSIIEEVFGVSLRDVPVQLRRGVLGDEQMATFRVEDPAGWRKYVVDLELAAFARYYSDPPEVEVDADGNPVTPLAIGKAEARGIAMSEAKRLMGAAFDKIPEWRESPLSTVGTFHLVGEAPAVGDPPRDGLTPRGSVTVSLVNGTIVWYGQFIPIAADPIPPKIGKDEAVRIAAERLGQPDAKPDKDPTLYQDSYGRGELTWMVRFVTFVEQKEIGPDGKETVNRYPVGHLYTIDALTGEIVKEE